MPVYNFGHLLGSARFFPDGLRVAGPVLAVQIEIPSVLAAQLQQAGQVPPSPVTGIALIDTGASVSAVDEAALRQLTVQPTGIVTVGTAGGQQQQAVYPARFVFPGSGLPSFELSEVLGADLTGQTIPGPTPGSLVALFGRDILSRFVFIYNGLTGTFTLGC